VLKQDRREFLNKLLAVAAWPSWAREAFSSTGGRPFPYLQNVCRNSASVMWTALDHTPWRLRYSADQCNYKQRSSHTVELPPNHIEKAYTLFRHKVALPDLNERSEYSYQVDVEDPSVIANESARFQTDRPGEFTFLAFGDSGTGGDNQRALAARIVSEQAALVLHTGDVGQYRGAFFEYENFYFPFYQALMRRTPFYPTPGNHDYGTNFAFALLALHDTPTGGVTPEDQGRYYSFDWSNAHFVCLDSNVPLSRAAEGRGRMLDWLEQDLAATRKFWKIVFFHHPPYATTWHVNDPQSALAREHIVPILDRHGAHLVLNGHEHNYQRTIPLRGGTSAEPSQGIVYVTTAGGGADLYGTTGAPTLAVAVSRHHYLRTAVDGAKLTVRAIDINGEEIDAFTLAPPPELDEFPVVEATALGADVAPGGLILVRGRHLAVDEGVPEEAGQLTEYAGVSVEIGRERLRLLHVSPMCVKAMLPFNLGGHTGPRVNAPNGCVETGIDIVPAAPGILYATGPCGEILSPAGAIAAGSSITIYATGLGDVTGGPPDDSAAAFRETLCEVTVLVNGSQCRTGFAMLGPKPPGVYQVPFAIPSQCGAGLYNLSLMCAGRVSNSLPVLVPADE
jgi:uncharacterized protein (TIGR03437 family)